MTFRSVCSMLVAPLVLAGAWTAASGGCQANAENNGFGGSPSASTTTTGGQGGQTGGSGGHSQGGSNGAGGEIAFDAGVSEAGLTDATACVSASAAAELIPLDMLILLDRSGSMDDSVKWPGATTALKAFVNDPASTGVNVGITYFPVETQGDDCIEQLYEKPAIDVGPLPANSKALVASIDKELPDGSDTPTWGALNGALRFATARQDANPNHKVILVFATDGDPTACTSDQQEPAPTRARGSSSPRSASGPRAATRPSSRSSATSSTSRPGACSACCTTPAASSPRRRSSSCSSRASRVSRTPS